MHVESTSPFFHNQSGALLTPTLDSVCGIRKLVNPLSSNFHVNLDEQTLPATKFHQPKIQTTNEDDDNSQLLFADVSLYHAIDSGDVDTEKLECFRSSPNSIPLDDDSFYSGLEGENNCNIDIGNWLSQTAFASSDVDPTTSLIDHSDEQEQQEEDFSPPQWVGKECTIDSMSSLSFASTLDGNTQVTASSAPSSPLADDRAPSSPSSSIKEKSSRSKRNATFSTTERKLRKKSQNKSAAEKYRVRKKTEKTILQEHHTNLVHANKELKLQVENMAYRVEQLKHLFLDLVHMPVGQTNK